MRIVPFGKAPRPGTVVRQPRWTLQLVLDGFFKDIGLTPARNGKGGFKVEYVRDDVALVKHVQNDCSSRERHEQLKQYEDSLGRLGLRVRRRTALHTPLHLVVSIPAGMRGGSAS